MTTSRVPVKAFLSCSVREADRPLVAALVRDVLEPMGFACYTVGWNVSAPDHVDDVIRRQIEASDCLIGVATLRLQARDLEFPGQSAMHATPYLLQETAAAHQLGLPWLVFKTPEVTLQGVTGRNLYLEIHPALGQLGKVRFICSKDLLRSSLRELHDRAVARQTARQRQTVVETAKTVATAGGVLWGAKTAWDLLVRPACFGEFYYRDAECKTCRFKPECKVEKARRQS